MDKDKIKNSEIDAQIISKEDLDQHNSRGVYMRDDHCDWGSSGLDQLINPINETNQIFLLLFNFINKQPLQKTKK